MVVREQQQQQQQQGGKNDDDNPPAAMQPVTTNTAPPGGSNNHKRRRKNKPRREDPYTSGSVKCTTSKIRSTGRPGSPHSVFQSSHHVTLTTTDDSAVGVTDDAVVTTDTTRPNDEAYERQIVHRHANGLCVVTVGDAVGTTNAVVDAVEFLVACDDKAVGGKNKKKFQKNSQGMVRPTDALAKIRFDDGRELTLYCCVHGKIVELNRALVTKPSLLSHDPLQDGYLAIIVPLGAFPPPVVVVTTPSTS